MDRGAWRATVQGFIKSQTRPRDSHCHFLLGSRKERDLMLKLCNLFKMHEQKRNHKESVELYSPVPGMTWQL